MSQENLCAERFGLEQLRSESPFRVPEVIASGSFEFSKSKRSVSVTVYYLLLECIPFVENITQEMHGRFGTVLAQMHAQCIGNQFGFDIANYHGPIRQTNTWCDNWTTFLLEHRLKPLINQVEQKHQPELSYELIILLNKLLDRLDLLFENCSIVPCLIHGDLSQTNWGVHENEKDIVAFDPVPCYAHSEMDLAVLEYCAYSETTFYDEYHKIVPKQAGFELRQALYLMILGLEKFAFLGSVKHQQYVSKCVQTLLQQTEEKFQQSIPDNFFSETLLPVSKLRTIDSSSTGVPVVLVLPGSFSPVHKNHMSLLQRAKEGLNELFPDRYFVCGGYMAPVLDFVVRKKLKGKHIPLYHRLNMLQITIQKSDWISIDKSMLLSNAMLRNTSNIVSHTLERNVTLVYVCGSDVIKEVNDMVDQKYLIVCIHRNSYEKQLDHYIRGCKYKDRIIVVNDEESDTISSTAIRNQSNNSQSMMDSEVYDYYLKYLSTSDQC
jgi:fructosamine-3-kinase/nicotinic acid mononucleotide adenylyltransferase